jgi:hypothetical protein
MLSRARLELALMLFLTVCLTGCVSQQERSQAVATEILEGLPVPNGATLLYTGGFERVSRTGMGTHFGARGLLGSNVDYLLITTEHRELLSAEGWVEYAVTNLGNTAFCKPELDGIRLEIFNVADFAEVHTIPADLLCEYEVAYETLYVVQVSHYPFDDLGACE